MYNRDIFNLLVTVLKEDVESYVLDNTACKVIPDKVFLSSACQAVVKTTVGRLVDAFVTKHNWVHTTYNEIIKHPFSMGYNYTPVNVSPIIGFSSQLCERSIYKKADGVIYTETKTPLAIKYFKVKYSEDEDNKYILYGNRSANNMECKKGEVCNIFTLNGNDKIDYTSKKSTLYLSDFDKKNDKLIMNKKHIKKLNVKKKYTIGEYKGGSYLQLDEQYVNFMGIGKGEVEGWVSIATGKKKVDPSVFDDNPIIIK